MREIVEKLVIKYWEYNWNDSRTQEDMVDWIMKFADELVAGWLEEYMKKLKQ